MKRIQFALSMTILLTLSVNLTSAQTLPKEEIKKTMSNFLKYGMHHGLLQNAIPTKLVNTLIDDKELWVGKCSICRGVKGGLEMYASKTPDKGEKRLKKSILKKLNSEELSIRKEGLKLLVDLYIKNYFTYLEMTQDEQEAMQEKLEVGRKKGMAIAKGGEGFYCSSCDGACQKK